MPQYPSDSDIGSYPPSTGLTTLLAADSPCDGSFDPVAPSQPALVSGAPSRASLYSDPTSDGSWSIDPTLLSTLDFSPHVHPAPTNPNRQTSLNRSSGRGTASENSCPGSELSKVQSWLESNCMTAGDFALFASDSASYRTTPRPLSTNPSRAVSACPDDCMPPMSSLAPLDDHISAYHASGSHHNVPQPGYNNARKRTQDSMGMEASLPVDMALLGPSTDISTSIAKRSINAMRPKSPRFDVDAHSQSHAQQTSRSRSRSDVAGRQSSMLEVPNNWVQQRWLDADLTLDPEEDDFDAADAGLSISFGVADAPAAATPAAFSAHVQSLNPSLDQVMVERITAEQVKRHKRLLEQRAKHEAAVVRKSCASGARCGVLGQGPNYALDSFTSKGSDGPPALFHVLHPAGSSLSSSEQRQDSESSIPATFPEGIPIPPVTRLPAEFECPLCFQVKRFMKPSDWTKHVHEDVQPFTCTFPSCAEPKSFKRKADWVRHESERHRHLESWRCDVPECWHVCYRKDNFVQHLVREHRLPESRSKTSKSGNKSAGQDDIVARLVVKCRTESTKQSIEEPCRFCGTVCNSWKKLTVHLAKHMEQISMPVLELIGHRLPRFENQPIHARKPLLLHPQPHSWSMPAPSSGPAISVTNTSGTTGLEHAPPAVFQPRSRAASATPSFASARADLNAMHDAHAAHWADGGPGMLAVSTASSSPYASVRSHSIPQHSMPATPYSSVAHDSFDMDDGMLAAAAAADDDKYPHPSWRGERLPQLHTAGLWHDGLPQSPPGMTADGSAFESAGAFSSPRNIFEFDASFDAELAANLQGFGAQDFSSAGMADAQQQQHQWAGRGDGQAGKRADGRYGHM